MQLQVALTAVMDDKVSVEWLLSIWFAKIWGVLICRLVGQTLQKEAWVITSIQFIVYYCFRSINTRLMIEIHKQIKGLQAYYKHYKRNKNKRKKNDKKEIADDIISKSQKTGHLH